MIRRICAIGGLLALFLQGSTGGHMLLVEHSRCAEHGDWIHEGEAHAHELGEATEATGTALFAASHEDVGEAAHEHCSHSVNRRDGVGSTVDPALTLFRVQSVAHPASTELALLPESARYRVAPKTSPPA